MATMTYPQVFQAMQQLSPEVQLELAEALLHNLRTTLSTHKTISKDENALVPIIGLTYAELRALADAVVAADRQEQLQQLLERNREKILTTEEQETLDNLLTEADQVALLKARALYTIQLFDLSPTTAS